MRAVGRRAACALLAACTTFPGPVPAVEVPTVSQSVPEAPAVSRGVPEAPTVSRGVPEAPAVSRGVPELSNSIVASRDTNVSPREIYDFLRSKEELRPTGARVRALDLGAGAGVSTQVLWDVGWRDLTAVDPSRLAWDKFAAERLPAGVAFRHASDEQFMAQRRAGAEAADREPFDLVVVNYAINHEKAVRFARELLAPGGRMLAPTNVQEDYWFKQQYELLDASGAVLWTKGTLWSYDVLFQPDFTSPTCQGQWCPGLRTDDAAKQLLL